MSYQHPPAQLSMSQKNSPLPMPTPNPERLHDFLLKFDLSRDSCTENGQKASKELLINHIQKLQNKLDNIYAENKEILSYIYTRNQKLNQLEKVSNQRNQIELQLKKKKYVEGSLHRNSANSGITRGSDKRSVLRNKIWENRNETNQIKVKLNEIRQYIEKMEGHNTKLIHEKGKFEIEAMKKSPQTEHKFKGRYGSPQKRERSKSPSNLKNIGNNSFIVERDNTNANAGSSTQWLRRIDKIKREYLGDYKQSEKLDILNRVSGVRKSPLNFPQKHISSLSLSRRNQGFFNSHSSRGPQHINQNNSSSQMGFQNMNSKQRNIYNDRAQGESDTKRQNYGGKSSNTNYFPCKSSQSAKGKGRENSPLISIEINGVNSVHCNQNSHMVLSNRSPPPYNSTSRLSYTYGDILNEYGNNRRESPQNDRPSPLDNLNSNNSVNSYQNSSYNPLSSNYLPVNRSPRVQQEESKRLMQRSNASSGRNDGKEMDSTFFSDRSLRNQLTRVKSTETFGNGNDGKWLNSPRNFESKCKEGKFVYPEYKSIYNNR